MKDFKDIYNKNAVNTSEGVLSDIDNTINATDSKVNDVLKEKVMQYFNCHKRRTQHKGSIGFARRGEPLSFADRNELIDKCVFYDGNIITINLNNTNLDNVNVNVCWSDDMPMIKFIDSPNNKIVTNNFGSLNIFSRGDLVLDLKKIIHPDSISNVVRFGTSTKFENFIIRFKDNHFPGTIKNFAIYKYCMFEKVMTNKWPKCKLVFDRYAILSMFMHDSMGSDITKTDYNFDSILITLTIN